MTRFLIATLTLFYSTISMAWGEAEIIIDKVEGVQWDLHYHDLNGNPNYPKELFTVSLDTDPGFSVAIHIEEEKWYKTDPNKRIGDANLLNGSYTYIRPSNSNRGYTEEDKNIVFVVTATKYPSDEIFDQVKVSIPIKRDDFVPIITTNSNNELRPYNMITELKGAATVNIRLRDEPDRDVPVEVRSYVSRSTFFGEFSGRTFVLNKTNWEKGLDVKYTAPISIPNEHDRKRDAKAYCQYYELYEITVGKGWSYRSIRYTGQIYVQTDKECLKRKAEQMKKNEDKKSDDQVLSSNGKNLDTPVAVSMKLKQWDLTVAKISTNTNLWDNEDNPTLRFYCDGPSGTVCSLFITAPINSTNYYSCSTSNNDINVKSGDYVDIKSKKLIPNYLPHSFPTLKCYIFSDNDFSLKLLYPFES